MKEVFISYSTIDAPSAETLRNVLEKNGLSCWMAPRDIPGGSNYTKEIPGAIRNCKVFLLVLSKNAQTSQWVLKELDSAVNCGKVILPFMLEDCALNDEFNFLLTGAQRYSAYQKKAEAIETLIARIRGVLEADGTSQPSEQPAPPTPEAPSSQPVIFTEAACPACGSSDLKPLSKRVKRQNAKEIATVLLIPLFAVICGFLGLLVVVLTPIMNWPGVIFPVILGCAVAGGFWGNHISKTILRRSRLRNRQRTECYRCKTCNKLFNHTETLEN